MEYELGDRDVERLRSLAQRQREIAGLAEMDERRRRWRDINDGVSGTKPPFAIETWTFDRDFMPDSIFKCETNYGRRLEGEFLRNIRHYEILGDDHVCPPTIDMHWHVSCDEFGIDIPVEYEKDAEGKTVAYHFECPIKDLSEGFGMVKPSSFSVDREGTMEEKDYLDKCFGDIIPVALRSGTFGSCCLTQRLMRLMSMETMLFGIYDAPEQLHGIMRLLCDNAMRMSRWAEKEGLLVVNNEHQQTCGTCYNFTSLLPRGGGGKATLNDMWGTLDSQETVGVSPEVFHEFFFPYYAELAEMFGLVYWGCCEPAHPIWDMSLSRLPNLKAVSISKWCDQKYMAERLDGRKIVFSRKPDPNILGVSAVLDEELWRCEIRNTLEIVSKADIPLQIVVRDVYTMHENLGKATRAVEIAREEIDRFYN